LRYLNPNGELDGLGHARTYGDEVRIELSLLDCVLNGERALYASSELTTGRRLYELLRQHGVRDLQALRARLGADEVDRQLWQPNVAAAAAFARSLRERFGGRDLVVTPAFFSAAGWSQPEYLAFWETLIRSRFKAVYFHADWEYSNGCAFEFAVAQSAGLPTFDAAGRPLDAAAGGGRLSSAARALAAAGFDTGGLRQALAWLGVPATAS
jgi:hypothetical protein